MNKWLRYVCLGSVLILLVGCYNYKTKVENLGAFEYTEYWRYGGMNPHGHSEVYKRKLCSSKLSECWAGVGSLNLYDGQRYLTVRIDGAVRFLDTQTGTFVSCKNCTTVIPGLSDFIFPSGIHDGAQDDLNGLKFFSFSLVPNGENFDVLVRFNESLGELTLLQTENRSRGLPRLKTGFSPDGSKIAWYSCSPLCTLVVYDFSKAAFNYTDTPCAKKNGKYLYLLIDWVDEKVVSTQHRAALRNKNAGLCTKPDGTPYFPVAM